MSEDLSAYAEDAAPAIGDNAGAALDNLVDRLVEADDLVERCERELKSAKEIAERIRTKDLPDAMEELGTLTWKSTTSGLVVEVEEKTLASPKKDDRPAVIAWLEEHGHSTLIKRVITVPFGKGKGQEEAAMELSASLAKQGLPASFDKTVHGQTLSAWVREALEDGETIPIELLGVRTIKRAKFKK